jgi:WD40 repeat protein
MVTASAYSADRKWAVMAQDYRHPDPSKDGGGRVTVYDTATWQAAHVLDLPDMHDFLRGAAITPDGKRVFLGWDGLGVHVWDTAEKKLGKRLDADLERTMCRSLQLTPDGKLLIGLFFVVNNTNPWPAILRTWNAGSGEVVRTIPIPLNGNHADGSIAITDSGRTVAVTVQGGDSTTGTGEVIEWDVNSGEVKKRVDLATVVGREQGMPVVTRVAYSADAKQMIVGGGFWLKERSDPEFKLLNKVRPFSGSVWVIDRESGKVVKTLLEHRSDLIRSLSASADGKKVHLMLTLPSRYAINHGGLNTDAEFVELQQWDVATWERDWVKIVPTAERWKLLGGAK